MSKFLDTSPETEKIWSEVLRRLGPEKRLKQSLELTEIITKLFYEGIREHRPKYQGGELIMTIEEVLAIVLDKLEESGLQYMLTGSLAASLHGFPRSTLDADIVIQADASSLSRFLKALPAEFYRDETAAWQALASYGMFNLIHYKTGFKIDLIIKKSRLFSQEEFGRRRIFTFLGRPCWFATAEDTILSKLEWFKIGGSERQFDDALGIAKIQGESLDLDYLKNWSKELEVSELLEKLLKEAKSGRE